MKYNNYKSRSESVVSGVSKRAKDGSVIEVNCSDITDELLARTYKKIILEEDSWVFITDECLKEIPNFYSHPHGIYYAEYLGVRKADHIKKAPGLFPYKINREYAALKNMGLFQAVFQAYNKESKHKLRPIKHTFGIEYESCGGAVPQDECFRNGMIPLRDGSINGIEYASVVMNDKYMHVVAKQVEAMREFTNHDKDCSIHIHFGNVPIDCDFAFVLYTMLQGMQNDIAKHFYEWVFNTERYKTSGKSYCQSFGAELKNTDAMYEYFSEGMPYFGTPYEPHPRDIGGEHKWQINRRYFWCNLINLMFYDKAKTVEFRLFRPISNPHKLIGFIHLFSAILERAEEIYNEIKNGNKDFSKANIRGNFKYNLEDIPGLTGRDYLTKFLDQLKETRDKLDEDGDHYCSSNKYDNIVTELGK